MMHRTTEYHLPSSLACGRSYLEVALNESFVYPAMCRIPCSKCSCGQVSLLARNLSPSTRDLIVMFTEEAPSSGSPALYGEGNDDGGAGPRRMKKLTLEKVRGGLGGPGIGRDAVGDGDDSETGDDDDDDEATDLFSPPVRSSKRERHSSTDAGSRRPLNRGYGKRSGGHGPQRTSESENI